MIIYCNNYNCLFNEPIDESHWVGEDKPGITPFEDDTYRGKCSYDKVFVRNRKITTMTMEYNIPECVNFSDKKIKGHMDFSKFPQGGNIG